ncbi:flagellar hook protein FlgE [Chthonobacter rhizosphaerae]|uniref:flagellar hook protein FlgE n=1 Tax=Chthonobacter rhizosphaerae TaxID=2735553 RepID=UPI0015EEA9CC|nr:flagellar hook protein FlgE [Chthonobacter rhizosphaerae]
MSLSSVLRTGVSGMNAQANKLGTVADNIANANTTGYKRSSVEFSTMVFGQGGGDYDSGSVRSNIIRSIGDAGSMRSTQSTTDLAIEGGGFFVVQDESGGTFLTRAGSFVPDSNGNLVNASGMKLLGSVPGGTMAANSTAGLVPINLSQVNLSAVPSRAGTLSVNLNSNAAVVTTPASSTTGTPSFTSKTSLVAYDNLGNAVTLDVFYSKTAANTWEVAVFNAANRPTTGTLPYTAAALATVSQTFNGNGQITAGQSLTVAVPGGGSLALDLGNTTQLAKEFEVRQANVDGNPPSKVREYKINQDGLISAVYESGTTRDLFQIALGDVAAANKLSVFSGNLYSANQESGAVQVGLPRTGGLGAIKSGALEQSNVDLAGELTEMIESQRSYTANSKVFQTGADLLTELVNLKR